MGTKQAFNTLSAELQRDINKFVEVLQQEEPDIFDENYYDYDLLMQVIDKNEKTIVSMLLDKGYRVNVPKDLRDNHSTPLHKVAQKNWFEIAEELVVRGARVTDLDEDKSTPVHVAFAYCPHAELLSFLLNRYLQVVVGRKNLVNNFGLSFIHIISAKGTLQIMKNFGDFSLSDCQINKSYPDRAYHGWYPLHFAAMYSQHDIAKFLLDIDEDFVPDYVDFQNRTALHIALDNWDTKMIDVIGNAHYDVNTTDDYGMTTFMALCAGEETTNVIIDYINDGRRAGPELMDVLVNSQIHMDVPRSYAGYTALHFACERQSEDHVNILLDNGAHLYRGANDLSPLDIAERNTPIRARLETHSANCDQCFVESNYEMKDDYETRLSILLQDYLEVRQLPVIRQILDLDDEGIEEGSDNEGIEYEPEGYPN